MSRQTSWRASLRPASWRGLLFQVQSAEALAGRRVHLHEYPFRDEPWAEDLGRRTRAILVKGYLIGDDVADQLDAFQAAAEEKGSGPLVHPLRGDLDVTLMALSSADAWDHGRVVKLTMEFVETGERRFPTSATDGRADVAGAAGALEEAAAESSERGIIDTLRDGYEGTQRIATTARSYVAAVRSYVNSAMGAVRSVGAVVGAVPGLGNLGRYINAGTSRIGRTLGSATSMTSRVSSVLSRINGSRANVSRLGDKMTSLVQKL